MARRTVASNPGNLRVQFWRWIRTISAGQGLWILWFLSLIPAGFALRLWDAIEFWLALLLPLCLLYFSYVRDRVRFQLGDVNPAVVVSIYPPLIAVHANLSTGGTARHVIKVLPHCLKQMSGFPFHIGERLATVATYQGTGARGFWDDVHPLAVNLATNRKTDIARVLATISENEWDQLRDGLKQLPTPLKPGLYPITLHVQTDVAD